jgi:hypothetical protein
LYKANKIKKIKRRVLTPDVNTLVTNEEIGSRNVYDEVNDNLENETIDQNIKTNTDSDSDSDNSLSNYSIYGTRDNDVVTGSPHIFEEVKRFDYPLNNSSISQSSHYIPETKHDNIEIGVNKEFKIIPQEEDPIGYDTTEHFTYFVGEKFDKLYH